MMFKRVGAISFLTDWKNIKQHLEILFFDAQLAPKFYLTEGQGMCEIGSCTTKIMFLIVRVVEIEPKE
jgi:hypothetical protein